jgi:hypothetical protein
MNMNSLAEAQNILKEAASLLQRECSARELLRFSLYFAIKRISVGDDDAVAAVVKTAGTAAESTSAGDSQPADEQSADQAGMDVRIHAEDTLEDEEAREAPTAAAAVTASADSVTAVAAATAGPSLVGKSKAAANWDFAIKETKQQMVSQLRMENEMLRRNEAQTAKLRAEIDRLTDENRRVLAECRRLQESSDGLPTRPPPASMPPASAEERLAALNWLVRSKAPRPATAGPETLRNTPHGNT